MAFRIVEHLGAQVLWRPTKRVRSLIFPDDFGQTEISNLDMAIHVNENILWLYVTVNYIFVVKVLEAEQNLTHVKLCKSLRKFPLLKQVAKKFTSCTDIHNEEKFFSALESPVKLYQKGMVEKLEDFSLGLNWADLILIYQLVFAEDFNSIKAAGVFLASKHNSTESSSTNHFDLFKVQY